MPYKEQAVRALTNSTNLNDFPPQSVEKGFSEEWNSFLSANSAVHFYFSKIFIILTIINCLRIYRLDYLL